jgi:hypothetical protein
MPFQAFTSSIFQKNRISFIHPTRRRSLEKRESSKMNDRGTYSTVKGRPA